MKSPNECRNIEEVRQAIDEIDQAIIGLIADRFAFIKEIVKFKSNANDVYAAGRFQTVINQRREMASLHHLDPDVIENMYRIMMSWFIKEQLGLLNKNQQ